MRLRDFRRLVKPLMAAAILVAVGWHFTRTLQRPEVWDELPHVHAGWLGFAGSLYLVSLSCPALYWWRLLREFGDRPGLLATVRAYYVGQLGRYVPGKVVGVAMRCRLLADQGCRSETAVVAIVYEALTTLATGALLASLFFVLRGTGQPQATRRALLMLGILGILVIPGFFNRFVRLGRYLFHRQAPDALPSLQYKTLLSGLCLAIVGWLLQGASLWSLLQGVLPQPQTPTADLLGHYTAFISIATLGGFVVVTVPGGLGVREVILQQFLSLHLNTCMGENEAAMISVAAVVILRLVWTATEVIVAGIFWSLPAASTMSPS
jgi:uncharacterized membrane protein YbhN (UPF0104 family)